MATLYNWIRWQEIYQSIPILAWWWQVCDLHDSLNVYWNIVVYIYIYTGVKYTSGRDSSNLVIKFMSSKRYCGMEYRMLPRAQCCCGLACACGVYVLGLRRSVLRNREFWGASFVFWPGSADWVDVCSGEADSPVCVLAVVCPTGDSVQRICVTGFCRVLRYRLWVVRPMTTSSGVFVCDRENCIGRTKAGCQRWVGNCVERRGEVLHQWWQRFTNLASPLDIYLHRCGGHLKTLRPVALRQVLLFLLANHRRPFKRPRVRTVWPRFPDSRHLIGWKEVTERLLYFVYKMTMILTAQLWGSCDALTSRFLLWK